MTKEEERPERPETAPEPRPAPKPLEEVDADSPSAIPLFPPAQGDGS
jgi:hypothetical protein